MINLVLIVPSSRSLVRQAILEAIAFGHRLVTSSHVANVSM